MNTQGTVLVVEDSMSALMLLKGLLADAGYRVMPANSGALALSSVEVSLPDLILLDLFMPQMDGFEVLRRLKSSPRTRGIPVVMLSAASETEKRLEGFRLGAADFISKPYQREELLARVRKEIDLHQAQAVLARQAQNLAQTNERLTAEIAERRAAELALQEQLRATKTLNDQLARTQSQLLQSEKMSAIGQLAAGVAHELNNPISFVNSNLNTLKDYVEDLLTLLNQTTDCLRAHVPAAQRAAVEQARSDLEIDFIVGDIQQLLAQSSDGTARVRKIVLNLKEFSHVSEDEWSWANLHKGLDSTLNIVWNELKYKAEVVKHYGSIPEIRCMPGQLNQVFLNLLVNAAQAIPDKGRIDVRTGATDTEVWVEVADTGKGIAPEHLKSIFEPFFTTKPVGKGTGLGLSLAYSIIDRHGGYWTVTSEPGVGTCMRVTLPVAGPPDVAALAEAQAEPHAQP